MVVYVRNPNRTLFHFGYYRLSHKSLNFLAKITSEYHKFGLVNYAILCSDRMTHMGK